jgi:short subunit dehydrogenase-like uncharacterized protein
VVINCAGPFTATGGAVIRAAIEAGTHYVDTSGEQQYLLSVFETLSGAAERARVSIVPACNDGCVPGDLAAQLLTRSAGPFEEIVVAHVITGAGLPSRGTLRSAAATIDALRSGGLVHHDGAWHSGVAVPPISIHLPGAAAPTAMAAIPLAEVVTVPRHVPVRRVTSYGERALVERLTAPLPDAVIDAAPEGPSARQRSNQRFTYVLQATQADGRIVRATIRGIDTYGTTAVISVEAARRLAVDGARPGVLTPAQAFDPATFLDHLTGRGLQWSIDDADDLVHPVDAAATPGSPLPG